MSFFDDTLFTDGAKNKRIYISASIAHSSDIYKLNSYIEGSFASFGWNVNANYLTIYLHAIYVLDGYIDLKIIRKNDKSIQIDMLLKIP